MFQSTLPHGERRKLRELFPCQKLFQSTLPHGERRAANLFKVEVIFCFNPRSRTGSDFNRC